MAFNVRTSGIPAQQDAATLAIPDVLPAFGSPQTVDQLRAKVLSLWDAMGLLISAAQRTDYRFPERLLWETLEALNLFRMTHGISLPEPAGVGHLHADYSQPDVPLRPLVWDGEDWVNYSPDIQPGGVMLDVILAPFLVNQGIVNAGNQTLVNALRTELRAGAPSGRDTFAEISAVIDGLQAAVAAISFASPAFTGVPTAPTAAPGTNTTQLATTAFAKAAVDAAFGAVPAANITGVLDPGRIPVLPSTVQIVSSGDLTALTSPQQAEIGRGSIVTTTDGRRRVYTGTGSKTSAGSYIELADITPEWDTIANRPTSFPANAASLDRANHTGTQAIGTVAGLQDALNDRPQIVAGIAALQALTPVANRMYRTLGRTTIGDGAGGEFVFLSGNYSAQVAADELTDGACDGGVWIAPGSDLTGASGAFRRLFSGPVSLDWYSGSAVTNHSNSLRAALALHGHVELSRGSSYVIGDVAITGAHVTLDCNYAPISPPAGAKFIIRNDGYACHINNFLFDDVNGHLVRSTTLSAGESASDTIMALTSATGMEVGMRISIELDTRFYHSTWIAAIAGNNVTITDALPSNAAAGKRVQASYAAIVNKDPFSSICGVRGTNVSAGIMIDDGTLDGGEPGIGVIDDVMLQNVRKFGIVQRRNANNNKFSKIHIAGGWVQTQTFTGNGSTTNFDLEYPIHLKSDITVTVNGTPQTLGTNYTLPASPGNRVQFVSAPANGAAISVLHFRDAIDIGFLDDPRGSTIAFGGNSIDQLVVLDCHVGARFINSELWIIGQITPDTCDGIGLDIDGGQYFGEIGQLFVGFCPKLVRVRGGATSNGWLLQGLVTNRTTASAAVSGTPSVPFEIETGSTIRIAQQNWRGDYVDNDAFTGGGAPTFMDLTYLPILPAQAGNSIGGGPLVKYIGPTNVPVVPEGDAFFQPARDGYLVGMRLYLDAAPGAGQSHTLTARVGGADTALTATIAGAGGFTADPRALVKFSDSSFISTRVDSTAGAAGAKIRGVLILAFLPN